MALGAGWVEVKPCAVKAPCCCGNTCDCVVDRPADTKPLLPVSPPRVDDSTRLLMVFDLIGPVIAGAEGHEVIPLIGSFVRPFASVRLQSVLCVWRT